jgi:hypothetical protein
MKSQKPQIQNENSDKFPCREAQELLAELSTLKPEQLKMWNLKAQALLTFVAIHNLTVNKSA